MTPNPRILVTAREQLERMHASLPLVDVTEYENRRDAAYKRIPEQAIAIVSDFLADRPKYAGDIDPVKLTDAVAYASAMRPIADAASALHVRIERSIRHVHAGAARDVLVLYGVLKHKARVDASLVATVRALRPYVATR